MEWIQILIIVGAVGAVLLAIVAIRGSFKNDDAFYGESTPVRDEPTTARDAGGSGDDGEGPAPSDGDGRGNGE